ELVRGLEDHPLLEGGRHPAGPEGLGLGERHVAQARRPVDLLVREGEDRTGWIGRILRVETLRSLRYVHPLAEDAGGVALRMSRRRAGRGQLPDLVGVPG